MRFQRSLNHAIPTYTLEAQNMPLFGGAIRPVLHVGFELVCVRPRFNFAIGGFVRFGMLLIFQMLIMNLLLGIRLVSHFILLLHSNT
jgi:hypothetical protein